MYSFQGTLDEIHRAAKFTKFGAVGDRFIVTFSGTFFSGNPDINTNGFQQVIYQGTQFDSTAVSLQRIGAQAAGYQYQFSITFDDVFSGADADLQTVSAQFVAVMNQYFDYIIYSASNARVIPRGGGTVNTGGGGGNQLPPPSVLPPGNANKPPAIHGSIYNTFFNAKGEMTSVGIGVLAVGSIGLLTLIVKNRG